MRGNSALSGYDRRASFRSDIRLLYDDILETVEVIETVISSPPAATVPAATEVVTRTLRPAVAFVRDGDAKWAAFVLEAIERAHCRVPVIFIREGHKAKSP